MSQECSDDAGGKLSPDSLKVYMDAINSRNYQMDLKLIEVDIKHLREDIEKDIKKFNCLFWISIFATLICLVTCLFA